MIAVLQIIQALEAKMVKQTGIPIKGFQFKNGELVKKPPRMSAPMAKAKRNKAHRQAKAWAKASRKST